MVHLLITSIKRVLGLWSLFRNSNLFWLLSSIFELWVERLGCSDTSFLSRQHGKPSLTLHLLPLSLILIMVGWGMGFRFFYSKCLRKYKLVRLEPLLNVSLITWLIALIRADGIILQILLFTANLPRFPHPQSEFLAGDHYLSCSPYPKLGFLKKIIMTFWIGRCLPAAI